MCRIPTNATHFGVNTTHEQGEVAPFFGKKTIIAT